MIIQNGQPRNYAICNGRNVAMLRGGQWIIKPFPLSLEVKSQIYADILDASLANEVWRAANLYCKAHQQAHPELTAQGKLLSTFVNNDPDMYASLPLTATPAALSAMPTRWLVGDGSAYIITNTPVNANNIFDFHIVGSTNNRFLGPTGGNLYLYSFYHNGSEWRWYPDAVGKLATSAFAKTSDIVVHIDGRNMTFNGTAINFYNDAGATAAGTMCIFKSFGGIGLGKVEYVKISSANIAHFIPCHTTANGMLDLETLTFYGNAASSGSFTIEKS